jgi:hypothetical protein
VHNPITLYSVPTINDDRYEEILKLGAKILTLFRRYRRLPIRELRIASSV